MKKERMRMKSQSGMTLIEILIVITLIAVIGAFGASKLIGMGEKGKRDATKGLMGQVGTSLDEYRRNCGSYPTTEQSLKALIEKPTIPPICNKYEPEGYIEKKQLKDGWGNPFAYESNGQKYILKCLGSDGAEGGEGLAKDFTSDDEE